MSRVCSVCGKAPSVGRNVSHSHKKTPRMFHPNVQKVRILVDGSPKRVFVCTKCLKADKVTRGQ